MTLVKLTQRLIFFMIIIICQIFCAAPSTKRLGNISFKTRCVDEINNFFCEQDSFLQSHFEEKELVLFMIGNNVYDTLYLPLYQSRKCNQVFFTQSDHIDYHHYENGSLVDYASDLIYLAPVDTVFKLGKGEDMRFLAIVPCIGQQVEPAVYNFTFEADSIGSRKTIHLTHRTWKLKEEMPPTKSIE